MDVKTLCLGLLSTGKACGYELKKEFESTFKHFFPAGYGSIYPALADLADKGLIECEPVPQTGKPDRKVYAITKQGKREFARALSRAQPQHKLRSEFLATIYFSEFMPREQLERVLHEQILDLQDSIKHINKLTENGSDELTAGARFTAGFGLAMAEAATAYIESNQDMLVTASRSIRDRQPNLDKTNAQPSGIENRP